MSKERWLPDAVLTEYENSGYYLQDKLIREVIILRAMVEWCCEQVWEGYNIDSGCFQDKAEEFGLIVRVPASEQVRDEYDMDWVYDMAWSKLGRESQQENGV